MICSEILLPNHAPREYADRQTLWNAVEKAERGRNAQLAYSFDIALQNEFSLDENIALARQFLLEHFVSRGMVVDFAVHVPDIEPGGISNPHFHVMAPIRPIEPDGTWGMKQRRVYELDEEGNRLLDATVNSKKKMLDAQTAEMKELQKLPDAWDTYKRLKPVADGLRNIKFTKAKEKYKAEHKAELNQFYAANRMLTKHFPDGKYNSKAIQARYAELEQQHDADYAAFKDLREETQMLWRIKSHIDAALKTQEQQKLHTQEHSI